LDITVRCNCLLGGILLSRTVRESACNALDKQPKSRDNRTPNHNVDGQPTPTISADWPTFDDDICPPMPGKRKTLVTSETAVNVQHDKGGQYRREKHR